MTLWSKGFEAILPPYMVQIETGFVKITILESKDKNYIQGIIKAIDDASARGTVERQ